MKRICPVCEKEIQEKQARFCPWCGIALTDADGKRQTEESIAADTDDFCNVFVASAPAEKQIDGNARYEALQKVNGKAELFAGITAWLNDIRAQNATDLNLYAERQRETVKVDFDAADAFLREHGGDKTLTAIPRGTVGFRLIPVRSDLLEKLTGLTERLFARFRKLVEAESLYAAFAHDEHYGRAEEPCNPFWKWLFGGLMPEEDNAAEQPQAEKYEADVTERLKQACTDAENAWKLPMEQDPLLGCSNLQEHIRGFWSALQSLTVFSNLRLKVTVTVDDEPFELVRKRIVSECRYHRERKNDKWDIAKS